MNFDLLKISFHLVSTVRSLRIFYRSNCVVQYVPYNMPSILHLLFRSAPSAIALRFAIELLLLLFYRLGSLFTARKMETDNLNLVKKFLQVFAKRIAKTAAAPKCQTCECNSDDNGISYMDCYPCSYPTAANIEYVSRNKRMLHVHL